MRLGSVMDKPSQGDTPDPALDINDADWRQIEKAYGASLSRTTREEIVRATEAFLFFENYERTGEPLAKVKVILEAHDKASTRFFNELFGSPSANSDAAVCAHHLIDDNFKASRFGGDAAGLDALLDFLRAFHIACNTSIKHLNDASIIREDYPWRSWINRLAKILEVKSVPGGHSKDHEPFVTFVSELQKYVPAECQRHTTAIADALTR